MCIGTWYEWEILKWWAVHLKCHQHLRNAMNKVVNSSELSCHQANYFFFKPLENHMNQTVFSCRLWILNLPLTVNLPQPYDGHHVVWPIHLYSNVLHSNISPKAKERNKYRWSETNKVCFTTLLEMRKQTEELQKCIFFPFHFLINEDELTGEKKDTVLTQVQLIASFIYPIKSRILIRVVYFLFW